MTVDDALESINRTRRAAKDQWWSWSGGVEGVSIRLKGYRTWIQRFECPQWKDSGRPDIKVGEFRDDLLAMLNKATRTPTEG